MFNQNSVKYLVLSNKTIQILILFNKSFLNFNQNLVNSLVLFNQNSVNSLILFNQNLLNFIKILIFQKILFKKLT